jgi:hypothetical protein
MEKIKVTKEKYVPKFEEIEMFETIDGKKFINENEAMKHEEKILKRKEIENKYKVQKIDMYEFGIDEHDSCISSILLYVDKLDDETKTDLITLYPYLNYSKSKINDVKLGWNFFIETEYDSCSLGKWGGYDLYIYKLENVIKEKEEQLKKLREIR